MPAPRDFPGGHDDAAHLASQLAQQGVKITSDQPAPGLIYKPGKVSVSFTRAQLEWLEGELRQIGARAESCAAAPSATKGEMLAQAAQAHLADALLTTIGATKAGGS